MSLLITNNDVIKALDMDESTFYALKKRSPKLVLMIKKGLLADQLLTPEALAQHIKKDNKPRGGK